MPGANADSDGRADGVAVRLRAFWRRLPVDVVALIAIVVGVGVTHIPFMRYGMCFNDPSWYFHFGRRVLAGDVPYRDFVFQVGPLPIYTDAAFQGVMGSVYMASLAAGLFITMLRVFVMWVISRRLTSYPAAALLCVFCSLDPLFAFAHNWSLPHSQLFLTLSGLCFWLAARSDGREALRYLALAGFNAAMVVSARQSSAVMLGVVLLGVTTVMLVRKNYFTRERYVALWAGFAAALVLVFGALAVQGALGPAIQQMFLDAPSKKGVSGIAAVLDAISGGALVAGGDFSWWSGFLTFLGMPIAAVVAAVYLASRKEEVKLATVAAAIMPVALIMSLLGRWGAFNMLSDGPRTFFTVTTTLAVLFPDRLRAWFGLEPLVAIGFGTLPLASDWALEMSFPGRGWGDAPSLMTGVLLFALASAHLSQRFKLVLCAMLAGVAILAVTVILRYDFNPFAKEEARDGTFEELTFSSSHPILRGIRINESRKKALNWLKGRVMPGSTCFIYANMPTLYDLLQCKNPTKIDSTTADFIALDDAETALATLRAHPPEFIIAHENTWMNPPLTMDLHDDPKLYGGMNPKTSMAMHIGLRAMLADYDDLGIVSEVIGPELSKQASIHWDTIEYTRVYHRRQ